MKNSFELALDCIHLLAKHGGEVLLQELSSSLLGHLDLEGLSLDAHLVVLGVGETAGVLLGSTAAATVIEDGDHRSTGGLVHGGASRSVLEERRSSSSGGSSLHDRTPGWVEGHLEKSKV